MAERLKGTGSVYQVCTPTCPPAVTVTVAGEDGKKRKQRPEHKCPGKWVGTYEAGWTRRGTRRRPKVTAATKKGAEAKLRAARIKVAEAEAPTAGGKPTVKTWAERWLEIRVKKLRPTAYQSTASQVRTWIIPTIGHRRLDQLAPSDVRAVHHAMETAGRLSSTVQRAHVTLGKMLRDAMMEGYAVPPRLLLVEGPGPGENDRDALPLLDALAILEAGSRRPDASRWVAALLQGMRPAECLGLTWSAVDFAAARIDVSWQLKPLPYKVARKRDSGVRIPVGYEVRHLTGSMHLVRPKTTSGQRFIPMVPWMASALQAWREVAPSSRYGLVWPRADGEPQTDKADRAAWWSLTDAARVAVTEPHHGDGSEVHGRRPDLYEARHTAATLLRAAGADDETITAIMGHASILSSRSYLHTDETRTRAALEKVAGTLRLGE